MADYQVASMNGYWCECCLDSYCGCQAVDLMPAEPDEPKPTCYCCLNRRCACAGHSVYR